MTILNIDTTHEVGSVAIGKDGVVINELTHSEQRDHAGWIQDAIKEIINLSELKFEDLDAIAVTGGPGSYTGIRVGLATAKGLCYALKIPLIQINTLDLMYWTIRELRKEVADFYCPMIDARREEVWMGCFDEKGGEILEKGPQILTNFDFNKILTTGNILCFGSGATKYNYLLNSANIKVLSSFVYKASDMVTLSENFYRTENYSDLFYSEPYYLKEFYTNTNKG